MKHRDFVKQAEMISGGMTYQLFRDDETGWLFNHHWGVRMDTLLAHEPGILEDLQIDRDGCYWASKLSEPGFIRSETTLPKFGQILESVKETETEVRPTGLYRRVNNNYLAELKSDDIALATYARADWLDMALVTYVRADWLDMLTETIGHEVRMLARDALKPVVLKKREEMVGIVMPCRVTL